MRCAGKTAGSWPSLLDAAKGAAATCARAAPGPATSLLRPSRRSPPCSATCIPVWLGFRGGKGVATGAGAFLPAGPAGRALVGLLVFGLTLAADALRVGRLDRRGREPAHRWPPSSARPRRSGCRGGRLPGRSSSGSTGANLRAALARATERARGRQGMKVAVVGGGLVGHGPRRPPRARRARRDACSVRDAGSARRDRSTAARTRATCRASSLPAELRDRVRPRGGRGAPRWSWSPSRPSSAARPAAALRRDRARGRGPRLGHQGARARHAAAHERGRGGGGARPAGGRPLRARRSRSRWPSGQPTAVVVAVGGRRGGRGACSARSRAATLPRLLERRRRRASSSAGALKNVIAIAAGHRGRARATATTPWPRSSPAASPRSAASRVALGGRAGHARRPRRPRRPRPDLHRGALAQPQRRARPWARAGAWTRPCAETAMVAEGVRTTPGRLRPGRARGRRDADRASRCGRCSTRASSPREAVDELMLRSLKRE